MHWGSSLHSSLLLPKIAKDEFKKGLIFGSFKICSEKFSLESESVGTNIKIFFASFLLETKFYNLHQSIVFSRSSQGVFHNSSIPCKELEGSIIPFTLLCDLCDGLTILDWMEAPSTKSSQTLNLLRTIGLKYDLI